MKRSKGTKQLLGCSRQNLSKLSTYFWLSVPAIRNTPKKTLYNGLLVKIKNYVSSLLAKMGMERRTQIAAYVARMDVEQKHDDRG